ncbi:CrcB family protein [Rathayibacter sp. YIM 133350]|uniref:fluoride efflux transporter FluC n=1 Tax=Rathayibacter sp. YIM 133350 TaxID=3131992 RepID=UPI00307EEEB9
MTPAPASPARQGLGRSVSAVAVGGLVGTGIRLAIDAVLPHAGADFPWATLLINVSGALALGWLVGGIWKRPHVPSWLRAGLGAGVLGSYTTFSAMVVSVIDMGASDAGAGAAAYLAASLVVGFAAAALGLAVGSRQAHRRMPHSIDDAGRTL